MVSPSLFQFFLCILNSESIFAREKRYIVSGVNLVMKNFETLPSILVRLSSACFWHLKYLHFDSKVLFPKEDQPSQKDAQNGESVRRGGINGQYELFTEVNLALQEQLKDLILNGRNFSNLNLCINSILHRSIVQNNV